jgi:hypothetical protein
MFKSAEEREAERREKEARQAKDAADRAEQERLAEEVRQRAAVLATPVGAATAAKEEGHPFLEVQLEVGGHVGSAGFGSIQGRRTTASSAAILGEIEQVGWRLEHRGHRASPEWCSTTQVDRIGSPGGSPTTTDSPLLRSGSGFDR